LHLRHVDMIEDAIARSSKNLTRMTKRLRKVCNKALRRFKRRKGFQIGSSVTNHCHKTTICTCSYFKYNPGRMALTWRRQGWVFGMMEVKHNRRTQFLKWRNTAHRQT
ncbi:unnamed protein product, partial [Oncorhynchus mykiss]